MRPSPHMTRSWAARAPFVQKRCFPARDFIALRHRRPSPSLSSALGELFDKKAADKCVPEFVWQDGLDVKQAFLQALFEGDGCVSYLGKNTVQISYSTRSEQLARDVQDLLLEFGVISRRVEYANGEIKLVIGNRRDANLFARRVGFWGAKQEKLESILDALPGSLSTNDVDRIPFLADYVRAESGARGL